MKKSIKNALKRLAYIPYFGQAFQKIDQYITLVPPGHFYREFG